MSVNTDLTSFPFTPPGEEKWDLFVIKKNRRVDIHRQQFSGRGRSSFPFSSIYSFPSKKVKKVGGYPIEKTPQSQELPPPLLEVHII